MNKVWRGMTTISTLCVVDMYNFQYRGKGENFDEKHVYSIQEGWELMGKKAILKEIGKEENEFLYFNRQGKG